MNDVVVDCRKQELKLGDLVAYATTNFNKSPVLMVGKVVKVQPARTKITGNSKSTGMDARVTVDKNFSSRGAVEGKSSIIAGRVMKIEFPYTINETP